MYKPPILEPAAFAARSVDCIGNFLAEFAVFGSKESEAGALRTVDGPGIVPAAELGFKSDLSGTGSTSAVGEIPPGDGRS